MSSQVFNYYHHLLNVKSNFLIVINLDTNLNVNLKFLDLIQQHN